MKKLCFFFFLFVCVVPFYSQDIQLDNVLTILSSRTVTKGSFIQKRTIKRLSKTIESSGSFIMSKKGVFWHTVKPIESSLAITDSAIIQTSKDGKKIVAELSSNQFFENVAAMMLSLFSGDINQLKSNFDISFSNDGSDWNINMTVTDATMASVMKNIILSGHDTDVSSITLEQVSGDTICYEFYEQTYPESLTNEELQLFKS